MNGFPIRDWYCFTTSEGDGPGKKYMSNRPPIVRYTKCGPGPVVTSLNSVYYKLQKIWELKEMFKKAINKQFC